MTALFFGLAWETPDDEDDEVELPEPVDADVLVKGLLSEAIVACVMSIWKDV